MHQCIQGLLSDSSPEQLVSHMLYEPSLSLVRAKNDHNVSNTDTEKMV